jgi:hypothetical protein
MRLFALTATGLPLNERRSPFLLAFVCLGAALLTSCGSSYQPSPPPAQDFDIGISPSSLTQQAGGAASTFTVSVNGQNGFTGSVSISLFGLPGGTTTSPSSPFAVAAGGNQAVTLSVPATIAAGNFTVMANGTSGTLTHSAPLPLTITSAKDFALSVSPAQVSATLGTTSTAVSISIAALNAFTGTVTLTLTGLPAGVTQQPAGPLVLSVGQIQALTFSIPATSTVGVFTIQIAAASGTTAHTGDVGLTINPVVTTSEDSTMFFLDARTSTDAVRLGLLKAWGAAITEVSLNGVNFVNHDDPGRQIQTSLWDGNATYGGTWGYNPIESGDHFFNGSPVRASTLLPDSIYTKTQPIQWAPENFGGGTGPVLGDAYIEKWISVVPGYNRVFKVHYKITHFGTDSHADANQELPVMYVNPIVPNFLYYGGSAPWTNDVLSQFTMPGGCCTVLPTTEQWGAYVDATNTGIALYTPMQYPNAKGFNAGSTLQFTPTCPYTWDPGSVLEFDTFILVGPVNESRAAIYALHIQQSTPSPLPPYGFLGPPQTGDTLKGNANIAGWAWALPGMGSIDVFVDGIWVASATYGLPRADVVSAQPGAPPDTGFQYFLDTTKYPNGSHAIIVKATDNAGHVATFSTKEVTFAN